jgi:hypothetical protein
VCDCQRYVLDCEYLRSTMSCHKKAIHLGGRLRQRTTLPRTGRVTNARQESDLGRAVHAVAAEIRPTTMAPSKMKSEVARSGLVIIK